MDAAQLAQDHWNETPLFLTEQERYSLYPWLYEVAEFKKHAGDKVLEIGCEPHHCKPSEFLAPWLGWYLVVKDQKPQANID